MLVELHESFIVSYIRSFIAVKLNESKQNRARRTTPRENPMRTASGVRRRRHSAWCHSRGTPPAGWAPPWPFCGLARPPRRVHRGRGQPCPAPSHKVSRGCHRRRLLRPRTRVHPRLSRPRTVAMPAAGSTGSRQRRHHPRLRHHGRPFPESVAKKGAVVSGRAMGRRDAWPGSGRRKCGIERRGRRARVCRSPGAPCSFASQAPTWCRRTCSCRGCI